MGPIAGARVGFAGGAYVLNPPIAELADGHLDLVVAGTRDGVLMVESQANELSEETMLGAVMYGHEQMQPVIDAIVRLAARAAREPWAAEEADDHSAVRAFVAETGGEGLQAAYQVQEKQKRVEQVAAVRADVAGQAGEDHDAAAVAGALKKLEKDIVRSAILDTGTRIDGRDVRTVRPIECRAGLLTRTHGSALLRAARRKRWSVSPSAPRPTSRWWNRWTESPATVHAHYNFPPYSVGETGRMFGPGRREIGHGKLAWRALRPLLPDAETFPYTIRVISEITESNGSSSMATVCGSSLALMDAGVPVTRPVAGIAMGLIKEGDRFAVLSDILGDEDHLGDMDFKVAGTRDGITSLQMDIKITGITEEIMQTALGQARDGRIHILDAMEGALGSARSQMSAHAPKIVSIKIPVDRIREIIGPGGKIIREICATSGATVDVSDDGAVQVASNSQESNRCPRSRKSTASWLNPKSGASTMERS